MAMARRGGEAAKQGAGLKVVLRLSRDKGTEQWTVGPKDVSQIPRIRINKRALQTATAVNSGIEEVNTRKRKGSDGGLGKEERRANDHKRKAEHIAKEQKKLPLIALDKALQIIHAKLVKKDEYGIFYEPVPQDVPLYYEMIKHPMDLTTVKMKLEQSRYESLDSFREDIWLICDNALTFNEPSTIYYKEAVKLRAAADELFAGYGPRIDPIAKSKPPNAAKRPQQGLPEPPTEMIQKSMRKRVTKGEERTLSRNIAVRERDSIRVKTRAVRLPSVKRTSNAVVAVQEPEVVDVEDSGSTATSDSILTTLHNSPAYQSFLTSENRKKLPIPAQHLRVPPSSITAHLRAMPLVSQHSLRTYLDALLSRDKEWKGVQSTSPQTGDEGSDLLVDEVLAWANTGMEAQPSLKETVGVVQEALDDNFLRLCQLQLSQYERISGPPRAEEAALGKCLSIGSSSPITAWGVHKTLATLCSALPPCVVVPPAKLT